jgi:hypothetical protein
MRDFLKLGQQNLASSLHRGYLGASLPPLQYGKLSEHSEVLRWIVDSLPPL